MNNDCSTILKIKKITNGSECILKLTGRLDTFSSQSLMTEVNNLEAIKKLVLDFDTLEYLSSSGLRVILEAQEKAEDAGGILRIINVNDLIMDIFDCTGFTNMIAIDSK